MASFLRTDTSFILVPWVQLGTELRPLNVNIFTLHIFEVYINESMNLRELKQMM